MPFSLAGPFVLGRPAADVDAAVQENFQQDHQAVLTTLDLSSRAYGLNQLRYDLRKLKGIACCSVTDPTTPTASPR
jgi:hypothetical protein